MKALIMIFIGFLIVFSCQNSFPSYIRPYPEVTWKKEKIKTNKYTWIDTLWTDNKGNNFLKIFIPGRSLYPSLTYYVYQVNNKLFYTLLTNKTFTINNDTLYFHSSKKPTYFVNATRFFQITNSSNGGQIISFFDNDSSISNFQDLGLYYNSILKINNNKIEKILDNRKYQEISKINETGIYYVTLPGLGVEYKINLKDFQSLYFKRK